ncbi:phosphoserine transaminase [Moraxella caviae]|uniref:Phosphoserine aminotransferase n=1 Tax=Moraxella caviae TaxID=34060 RepID=A0A1T0A3H1_9GAMM|nr:3-phosphoserine/phosphohydroxythreonine transaminase [Moraxella caviae]OOR90109.1 phosphoserine transaminase [Moraxella caviae]STZ14732.1 Phosphoserine aminotransferase [Moraxella caviae]VEW14024.1 Phosphoserine aminotransferase [Moraxella caviae]
MNRFANFCAGPAAMPTVVLERAQRELLDWQGKGSSVMEISHRSADYIEVAERAEANLRKLMGISDDYAVLFLQGGAALQFSAIPLNLMNGGTADYLTTGAWSQKAIKEAERYAALGLGKVNLVAAGDGTDVPDVSEWQLSDNAAYFHYCPNETIHGVQIFDTPKVNAPIVADFSSCILSEPVNVNDFGLIYAGAQKNIGPAGLTIVIVRKDLLDRASAFCPNVMNYKNQFDNDSMLNTPATFAWYLSGLVFEWLLEQGGVEAIAVQNRKKAAMLYEAIDGSDFYSNNVNPKHRSIMNVPFRLADDGLDKLFLEENKKAGLLNLKGHRVVGGMRASIYNAITPEQVAALVAFMKEFEARHG